MAPVRHLRLDPSKRQPLLGDQTSPADGSDRLRPQQIHTHPSQPSTFLGVSSQHANSGGDASVFFIGTATTIIEWQGLRILTDPNFLHKGDHVHLGPGVTAERTTNPAVDLHELPPIDLVLLSHYHEDHFDRLVEDSLNRGFPIVTTPHARGCLTSKEDRQEKGAFREVYDLDFFQSLTLHIGGEQSKSQAPVIKITGMPGKHVPPGPLAVANDLLGAVPPTNGWLLEMGWESEAPDASGRPDAKSEETLMVSDDASTSEVGYTIYISGDTLFVDELREIPSYLRAHQGQRTPSATEHESKIDLMLIHLGGTTIPSPKMPLLMVTMDAKQGVELMKLLNPDLTIPIHFDDYTVFLSPLQDFKDEIQKMGDEWKDKVVYLDRGDMYTFQVRKGV